MNALLRMIQSRAGAFRRLGLAAALLVSRGAAAVSPTGTDGGTPASLAPGSPQGAYAVTDFEHLSYFNGKLNFSLPLLGVSGRGDARMTVALAIQQHWTVGRGNGDLGFPRPDVWTKWKPNYGPGMMQGRTVAQGQPCTGNPTRKDQWSLTRFTFTAPDGTEYEFRDKETKGEPIHSVCTTVLPFRGKVFQTADGTFASFVSDDDVYDDLIPGNANYVASVRNPTGTMLLRDGTRYRIQNGLVTWMRDRNGNRLEFIHQTVGVLYPRVVQITDSLNRVVTVSYETNQDVIRWKGFGRASREIRVTWANLSTALAPGQTLQRYHQLFPDFFASGPTPPNTDFYDPRVVTGVVLANGRTYAFRYNAYGELGDVRVPTGGRYAYDWGAGVPDLGSSGAILPEIIYRRVLERRVYGANDALVSRMTISRPETFSGPYPDAVAVDVDEHDEAGQLLKRTRHHYHGSPKRNLWLEPTSYPAWKVGREFRTEIFSPDDTLLRTSETDWAQPAAPPWWTGDPADAPSNNPRVAETRTILDSGERSATKTLYGAFNNPIQVSEFDFGAPGSGTHGPLLRRTQTDYVDWLNGEYYPGADTQDAVSLPGLPLQRRVYRVPGQVVPSAQTDWEYDNYVPDARHAALVDRFGVVGHDAPASPSYVTRGNATAVTRWLDTTGGSVATFSQYDVLGNLVKAFDERGYATAYDFTDRFGTPDGSVAGNAAPPELAGGTAFAFVSTTTNPLGHTAEAQYDYYVGQAVDASDANGTVTSQSYDDPLERATRRTFAPNDGAERTETIWTYDDANRVVLTTSDLSLFQDRRIRRDVRYDVLGRETETRVYEDAGWIATLRQYDALNRTVAVSNPYRPASEAPVYTTTAYDAQGRTLEVETPDGAVSTTDYFGREALYTDPAQRKRRTRADALDRLVRVTEYADGPEFVTNYAYDVFDKVTTVSQSGQTRTYLYDSLTRLREVTLPESGTTRYVYDDAGNLTSVTDARGLVTTTEYDELGRVTIVRHFDGVTPNVLHTYDKPNQVPFSKGRLVSVSSDASETRIDEYDRAGRVKRGRQITAGKTFAFSYAYDRDGNLVSETYPSGRTVVTTFDAASRVTRLEGGNVLADLIAYTPHGAMASARFGNGRWERHAFNARLQPWKVAVGATAATAELLELEYGFGDVTNNGNLLTQDIRVAGANPIVQAFHYDGLNRVKSANEFGGWLQTYAYDEFGNRAVTSGLVLAPALTPTSLGAYDRATNRLTAATYDEAGNVRVDSAGRTLTYDAERRQTRYQDSLGTTSYTYDGQGRRVRRDAAGVTTIFVYDAFGKLVAEHENASAPFRPVLTYLHADPYGSTRLVTGPTGDVVSRHDYLPFGEEVPGTLGARPAIPGYETDDGLPFRFTGKERDRESRHDYFGGRYFASPGGRFLSPDEPLLDVDPADPRSWNRYAYGRNNVFAGVDPDGHVFKAITVAFRIGRALYKGYDLYTTVEGMVESTQTIFSTDARVGTWDRLKATGALVSEISGASDILKGAKSLQRTAKVVDEAGDVLRATDKGTDVLRVADQVSDSEKRIVRIADDKVLHAPSGRGRAPTGIDGHPVELHHDGQKMGSDLKEMTRTDHRGKGNFKKNHPNTGQSPSEIDRAAFDKEREEHWSKEWDAGRWNK